MFYIVYIELK